MSKLGIYTKEPIRKCQNPLCGKLIYDYQKQGKFCNKECALEASHYDSLIHYRMNSKEERIIKKTEYPHKTLPIVLVI